MEINEYLLIPCPERFIKEPKQSICTEIISGSNGKVKTNFHVFFFNCNSFEEVEQILSNEEKISSLLKEKVIQIEKIPELIRNLLERKDIILISKKCLISK